MTINDPKNSIELAYGRSILKVELPAQTRPTIIQKPAFPDADNPNNIIEAALNNPVSSPTVDQLAAKAASACILICDVTRPVPNHTFLRPIIKRMLAAGMALNSITILVATGLHRPNEGEELRALIGDDWVFENVTILNHFATRESDHVDLGNTKTRNTPVRLNKHFVSADLRIATGLVEPHFMAGYSGGRKVVAPGVAHHETIRTFHNAKFMEDPAAVQCNLVNNPLHEEQLEIVRMLGDVYALNTVIDEHRKLVFTSFGEIIESHLEAVKFAKAYTQVPVGKKFHTIVTSSAGFPLDQTYYQTVKGMVTPLDILEPGGTLIMVSECAEGIGSDHYREAQKKLIALGTDAFLENIQQKSLASIDEWQTEMQLKSMRMGEVILYAQGLSAEDHLDTGVKRTENVTQAIADAMAKHQSNDVAFIPEGPYVVPLSATQLT